MPFPVPDHLSHRITKAALLGATSALCACGGLPGGGGRPASTAIGGNDNRTVLARAVRPSLAAHPGVSGLCSLADARDALSARLKLADAAQRSLDVQYYIWKKDMAGKVMIERLLRAADRGVRVRLLLDDIGTMPSDEVLLAVDSHPGIEVRMFNPVSLRTPRMLGIATEFRRINKRMHNKSFIADGQVAIVGGRNIGDEYFDAAEGANFADLDVAAIGPVVKEVSAAFDLYWNHQAAVPITALARQDTTPEEFAEMRAALTAHHTTTAESEYAKTAGASEFVRQMTTRTVPYHWGRASILTDHPDKVLASGGNRADHLTPQLRGTVHATRRELFLVSPYFVPGKVGVDLLTEARRRGVRVVVITNSLASTDGVPVHAGYQRYRKPLLQAGVEIYEMKPNAMARRGGHGDGVRGSGGSSGASLHAKTFTFDRRIGFIGSYNLDPRSNNLNTEMGVLFNCPPLAKRLPDKIEPRLKDEAYRLELGGSRLTWVSQEATGEVRHTSEPGASLWKRTKVRILSWLPIEPLL